MLYRMLSLFVVLSLFLTVLCQDCSATVDDIPFSMDDSITSFTVQSADIFYEVVDKPTFTTYGSVQSVGESILSSSLTCDYPSITEGYYVDTINFKSYTGSVLLEKNKLYTIDVDSLKVFCVAPDGGLKSLDLTKLYSVVFFYSDSEGNIYREFLNHENFSITYSYNTSLSIIFDTTEFSETYVYNFGFELWYAHDAFNISVTCTRHFGFNDSSLTIKEYNDDNAKDYTSFLDAIIGWLSNIKDGITDMLDGILSIPSLIVDGIKNLFIPSQDDLIDTKDKFQNLMEDKFGFLAQCVTYVIDTLSTLFDSGDVDNPYINIPLVNLNLAGANFALGGWTVPLVPDFMLQYIVVFKNAINVIITCLFVNGLLRRYNKTVDGGADE